MRWAEEVELVLEEMRRVKQFLAWQAGWWIEQEYRREASATEIHSEGLSAYARRQARIRLDLKVHFEHMWRAVEEWVNVGDVPGQEEDEEHAEIQAVDEGQPDT